jgi:hypothetical protein
MATAMATASGAALPPNLCYTIALDRPGQETHRRLTRLLVTSLLRTGWHGRITVFRNTARPILPEAHPAVTEIVLKAQPSSEWHRTMSWKYRLRDQLDLSGIGKVLYLDCDCLALRSLNQLMLGSWDIYTAPEPGRITEFPFNGYLTDAEMKSLRHAPGLNAGTFGIRASRFREVMATWEKIHGREPRRKFKNRNQHSWNRLILDTPLRHRPFAQGEVQFPFLHRANYLDYRRAALVHAADRSPEEKLAFLFGLWMEVFELKRLEELTSV